MRQLGNKLMELRTKRGLSQDELAERLNASFGTSINKGMVSKWENNLSDPKLDHAKVLALFFNVSLDELLNLQNDIQTIAAHHDSEDWTAEELKEIEDFKAFVRAKRKRNVGET